MKLVSLNAAKAIAERFVPVPADSDRVGDFAFSPTAKDSPQYAREPEYVRALNLKAHEWLLQRAPYGSVWVHGRLRLSGWIHARRQIIFLARSAGLIISRSDLALPEPRPPLGIVNRGLSAAPDARTS
jgi:hypothetical protein